MQLILLALALLVAAPASAAVTFLSGCEDGRCADSASRLWSATGPLPTAQPHATTPTNGNTGNNWSARFNPASGNASWTGVDFASSNAWTGRVDLRLTTAPTVERILPIGGANGGNRQCFVTISPDRRLRLYYGDTGKECTQATNNGQPCATAADCTEVNPGEATCSEATFAKSAVLALNQWYRVAVNQDTNLANVGDARCGLWVDCVNAGTATRPQGACTGGSNNGAVCATNAACTGGGTCSFANKTTTRVVFGAPGTEAAAVDFNLDDWMVDSSAVNTDLACARLVDLHPNGAVVDDWDGTVGSSSCTSDYQCVDDTLSTGSVDDDTTALQSSTNAEQTVWALEDVTLAGDESIAAAMPVALQCSAKETADNANNSGKTYQLGIRNSGGTSSMGANIEVAGLGETYRAGPLTIKTTRPDGAPWSGVSDLNGTQMRALYTGSTGSGFRTRLTDCYLEALITRTLPPTPDALFDWNGDGDKTVCVGGDSQLFDAALKDQLVAGLTEPVNVLFCANGGRTCGDMDVGFTNMADGVTTGNVACEVRKGIAAKCDVMLLMCGANDLSDQGFPADGYCWQWQCAGGANAGLACGLDSDCPGSTCTGGPQHGGACRLPNGYHNVGWLQTRYCRQGASYLAKTKAAVPTPCVSGSQCTGSPTPGSDTQPCDITAAGSTWCHAGVLNSTECPGGLCVRATELGAVQARWSSILEKAAARSGASAMQLIIVGNYLPRYSQSCANTGQGCWNCQRSATHNLVSWLEAQASTRGLDFIDLKQAFRAACPDHDPSKCLRDGIHASTAATPGQTPSFGDEVIGNVFESCLEGTPGPYHTCTRLKPTPTPTP